MDNTINSDLIRGNIDTIILRALYSGDRYGYDIIKEIEQRSSGKYKLKQPTLYSCLNRLENQGFVSSYWGEKSIGGRRKYYTLTDMGKELFIRNRADWEYSKSLIDNLITEYNKQNDCSNDSSLNSDQDDDIELREALESTVITGLTYNSNTNDILDENIETAEEIVHTNGASKSGNDEKESVNEEINSLKEEIESLDEEEKPINNEADFLEQEGEPTYNEMQPLHQDLEVAEEEIKLADKETELADNETESLDQDSEATEEEIKSADEETELADNETEFLDQERKSTSEAESEKEELENTPKDESLQAAKGDNCEQDLFEELDEKELLSFVENMLTSNETNNYIDGLRLQQYVPDKNIYTDEHLRTDNYFKDFEDECEDDEDASEHDADDEESNLYQDPIMQYNHQFDSMTSTSPMNNKEESQYQGFGGSQKHSSDYAQQNEAINNHSQRNPYSITQQHEPRYHDFAKQQTRNDSLKQDQGYVDQQSSPSNYNFRPQQSPNYEEQKASDLFLSYKSDSKKQIAPQNPIDSKRNDDIYRIFEEKLAGIKKKETKKENAYVSPILDNQIAAREEPEFFRKDQIQIRNFKRLQDSAADMGEELKIRSYENASAKEFSEQYYFYSNKLKLRQYFVLFCFVLVEVILCYIAINLGLRKSLVVPNSDLVFYVFAVLGGLAFPTAAFLGNWSNPNKRKRINYSFAMQMLFSTILMIQFMLLTYILNVCFKMPLTGDSKYYTSLIVPMVMSINFPINTIVFNLLFKSKRYAI